MPNRILRDGILSSEAVNSLDWGAEVFFRRLMSVADDHGRYHALPRLLRAGCYPLHIDTVSDGHVIAWIDDCCQAGLVERYVGTDGKVYLQIVKFGQQVRAKSKFPDADPSAQVQPDSVSSSPQKSSASNCYQVPANEHLVGVVFGVGVGVEDGCGEQHCSPTASPNHAAEPDPKPGELIPEGFARFWEAVPNLGRKSGKGKALAIWRKKRLEPIADRIVAHVAAMGQSEGWRTGYQPLPATYLNEGRWDDPIPPAGPSNEARSYLKDTIHDHGNRQGPGDGRGGQPIAHRDVDRVRGGVPPQVGRLHAPGAGGAVVEAVLAREDPSERY